ncbi:MAG: hypothetical protein ABIL09_25910, partial [Gemmatimonadota bacterium]
GLFLDKAHGEEVRRFAAAYRSLPAHKLETVGPTTDPVAVRQGPDGDRHCFYLVNREYYEVRVVVRFSREPGAVRDLATGEELAAARSLALTLGPYELRSLSAPAAIAVTGFVATPAEDIARALRAEAAEVLAALAAVQDRGTFVPGAAELAAELPQALAAGRLAWVRRALSSYAVQRSRQVAGTH